MVKKLLPLFLVLVVAALAWRFWPQDPAVEASGEGNGGPVFTSLEGGEEGSNPNAGTGPPVSPSSPETTEPPTTAPEPAAPPATQGLKVLNQWHRASQGSWAPAAGQAAFAAALADFSRIWSGEGGAYAADLRIEAPEAFGPEFQAFAAAFADGGVVGLDRALRGAGARGPAWMVWTEALVEEGLREQQDVLAGPALGRLLEAMEADDYPRSRMLELQVYAAQLRSRPQSWAPYEVYQVVSGDSLDRIGSKYRAKGHPQRFGWMMEFNRKRNTNIRLDEKLKIPLDPLRLLGLRSKCILALYSGETPIHLYEVSYGKPGQETPTGVFTLTDFLVEPIDYGLSPPVPYGHPDHRLGTRWMGFAEAKDYGIHGNNCDDQVGAFESAGCVRMINGEVELLFELVPRGGKVEIRP